MTFNAFEPSMDSDVEEGSKISFLHPVRAKPTKTRNIIP